jgi:hypothetical protein
MEKKMRSYHDIITQKSARFESVGLNNSDIKLNDNLFDFQKECVEFALKKGRSALFAATGLGKTMMSLSYADNIMRHTNKPVLMLCPLGVAKQHEKESHKFGFNANLSREGNSQKTQIDIANYDALHKFDLTKYCGVILDESSILKGFNGKTYKVLCDSFSQYGFKLAATATPSPNDHMELGQHSQFLGALASAVMLSKYFQNDTGDTGQWFLKPHAEDDFWAYIASFSRCLSMPSDLGYSDDGYILEPLNEKYHIVKSDLTNNAGFDKKTGQNNLFRIVDTSATSIHSEKRMTADLRALKTCEIANSITDCKVIWVETNYDADAVRASNSNIEEIRGDMKNELKEELMDAFTSGQINTLMTKPSIAGFGLNWQHCHNTIFAGASFSFEMQHQAIRRFHRFGQKKQVNVHYVQSESETRIFEVLKNKTKNFQDLITKMKQAQSKEIQSTTIQKYKPNVKFNQPNF